MFDTNIDMKRAADMVAAARLLVEAGGELIFLPAKYPDRGGSKGITVYTGLITAIDDYGSARYVTVIGRDNSIETSLSRDEIEIAIKKARQSPAPAQR